MNAHRGELYMELGRSQEAVNILESVCVNLVVADLGNYVGLQNSLGAAYAYEKLGHYDKAMITFRKAHKLGEEWLGVGHIETLKFLANIAATHLRQGQNTEAQQIYQKIFNRRKTELGIGHPLTLTVLYNITQTYDSDGNKLKAVALSKELLELQLKHLGIDHMGTLLTQRGLGVLLTNMGKIARAFTFVSWKIGRSSWPEPSGCS